MIVRDPRSKPPESPSVGGKQLPVIVTDLKSSRLKIVRDIDRRESDLSSESRSVGGERLHARNRLLGNRCGFPVAVSHGFHRHLPMGFHLFGSIFQRIATFPSGSSPERSSGGSKGGLVKGGLLTGHASKGSNPTEPCHKEAEASLPLPFTGPYHLEGTTLANLLAASHDYKDPRLWARPVFQSSIWEDGPSP